MAKTRLFRSILLAAASAAALPSAPALAQAADESGAIVITGRRLSVAADAVGLDQTSNTVAVTREALLSAPAGISGLKMLEQLPGFNVQTDGALGLYEFGNSVTVRAFNLQQIGFVLDGVPMGRSDAFGGSPIFRYVDNENLGSVVASPGAGDVSQPTYASLGPVVEYLTIDPSDDLGGTLSYAVGDDNLTRSFIKLETGAIGPFSAYVSRSKTDGDLWRGAGYIDREHWEAKAVLDFDAAGKLSFRYISNDFFDYDSPGTSKAAYFAGTPCPNGLGGRDCGYAADLPPGTLGTVADYNVPGLTYAAATGWYLDRVNIRQDQLYYLTYANTFATGVTLEANVYYEDKDGYGVSPDSYSNTRSIYVRQRNARLPVTAPRGVQFGLSGVGGVRSGAVVSVGYDWGAHSFAAGGWVETDDYRRTQLRLNHEGGIQSGAVLYNEVAYFRRDYESARKTQQFFIKDTISLLDDKLTVDVGLKTLNIDYSLHGYRDFADYETYGQQTVGKDYFSDPLPMIGAVYNLTGSEQVFASWSKNFALPRGADDIFSLATAPANAVEGPEGETSENFEIGARTVRGTLNAAIAAYYTTFENRLETYAVPIAGQSGATETRAQNVGGVESYGVEFTGAWKPAFLNDLAYFNGNVTWNQTTFEDDIPLFLAGTPRQPLRIAGNTLPDSPEWMITAGVTVEPTSWIVANLSAKYVSDRYSNFTNTEEISDFTIASAYVDIGEGIGFGPVEQVKLRVNVDNLFDVDTLAFISSSVNGVGSFRPQSPRTLSVSLTADF